MGNGAKAGLPVTILKWRGLQFKIQSQGQRGIRDCKPLVWFMEK